MSNTGVKGVYQMKNGRYKVQVKINEKNYYLGVYKNIDDATAAIQKVNEQKKNNTLNKIKAKSGYEGVCERNGRWRAAIGYKGQNLHLGYFDTPQEASAKYQEVKTKIQNGRYHRAIRETKRKAPLRRCQVCGQMGETSKFRGQLTCNGCLNGQWEEKEITLLRSNAAMAIEG